MNEVVPGLAQLKATLDTFDADKTVVGSVGVLVIMGAIYAISHDVLVVNRGPLDQAQIAANLAPIGQVSLVQPQAPAKPAAAPAKAASAAAAPAAKAETKPAEEPAATPAAKPAVAPVAAKPAEPAPVKAEPVVSTPVAPAVVPAPAAAPVSTPAAAPAPIVRPMPEWMRHMAPLTSGR